MRFLISRTSNKFYGRGMEDIEEAREEEYVEEIIRGKPEVVKGWFIEINTLQELLNLKTRFNENLIITTRYGTDIPEIEIYDDYRE